MQLCYNWNEDTNTDSCMTVNLLFEPLLLSGRSPVVKGYHTKGFYSVAEVSVLLGGEGLSRNF